MDVYRQSAEIVHKVVSGHGTAKSLCLQKHVQKKKQTFAVVCETIRNFERIERILKDSEFFDYYPQLKEDEENKFLVIVMCYDAAIGRGINTRQHPVAIALNESAQFLKAANAKIPAGEEHCSGNSVLARALEDLEDSKGADVPDGWKQLEKDKNSEQAKKNQRALQHPRYARVNKLLLKEGMDLETVLARLRNQTFRRSGAPNVSNKRRQRNDGDDGHGGDSSPYHRQHHQQQHRQQSEDDDEKPVWDEHVPGLIVFPPGTDLHAHPMVKLGTLLLQDKASCLPAAVMFDKVPVKMHLSEQQQHNESSASHATFKTVVDGCAAPGNKTCQLSEYSLDEFSDTAAATAETHDTDQKKPKVIAIERDPKRFGFMQERMEKLGASNVECWLGAFQEVFAAPDEEEEAGAGEDGSGSASSGSAAAAKVDAILLDPSCSSSGVVSRIDVSKKTFEPAAAAGTSAADQQQQQSKDMNARVADLAAMQLELLTHALTEFPNVQRVVYSTCSIYQKENEDVVVQALCQANKKLASVSEKSPSAGDDDDAEADGEATTTNKKNKSSLWTVTTIMPNEWQTRGRLEDEEKGVVSDLVDAEKEMPVKTQKSIAARCIRCDPVADRTSGFFVARFDRALLL